MRQEPFNGQSVFNKKGITLIELLIAFAIFAIVIGGIYRVFIAQTSAYTVQDHVVEVQQNIRGAMQILVRDLQMAGYRDGVYTSPLITNSPIVVDPLNNSHITTNYEYIDYVGSTKYTTTYTVDYQVVNGDLKRQCNSSNPPLPTSELSQCDGIQWTILSNVTNLNFSYGTDTNGSGTMADTNNDGVIDDNDFVPAASVGTANVVAVRVDLTAIPTQDNPDVETMVSPRKLTSRVTLRNMCFRKSQGY